MPRRDWRPGGVLTKTLPCGRRKLIRPSSWDESVLMDEPAEDFGLLDEREVEIEAGDRLARPGAR